MPKKTRIILLFIVSVLALQACSSGPSQKPQSDDAIIKLPNGSATVTILDNPKKVVEAKGIAEKYLKAAKESDRRLFESVSPQELMPVIFEWEIVNTSGIKLEGSKIEPIRSHLERYFQLEGELEAYRYAKSLKNNGYEMLGDLLNSSYSISVVPEKISKHEAYELRKFDYIADVESQSDYGSINKKRIKLELYRMSSDSFDSGWKVLFIKGFY